MTGPMAGLDDARPPLRFGEPEATPGLPLNYMPAALRALRGERDAPALTLVDLAPDVRETGFDVVPPDLLACPGRLSALVGRPTLLGPPAPAKGRGGRQVPAFRAARPDPRDGAAPAALVVIDHGIAFWNPRFREADGSPLFRAIQVLDLDAQGGIARARIEAAEIAQHCATADGPYGQALVRRALGRRFPGSFWGRFVDADGLWHGTAMADIALTEATRGPGGAPAPALFGVELPASLVVDRGGDMLTAFLPTAIDAALGLTSALPARRVVICLSFGFTGGPQDGTHPAAQAIAERLGQARRDGREVVLCVPAGNHRQDRGAARLGPDGPASIGWRLPADDFSPNSVEICLEPGEPAPTLTLTAPDGEAGTAALGPDTFREVARGGRVIGGLQAMPGTGGALRLRLTLAPTALQAAPAQAPTPAGLWRIGVASARPVLLWTLRDDPQASDRAAPHRLSLFADDRWRDRNRVGDWRLGDEPGAVARRAGSVSVLATAPGVLSVGASERRREAEDAPHRDAPYSGRPLGDGPPGRGPVIERFEVVEDRPRGGAFPALGNGGRRVFRVSGTSVAAARAAGKQARRPPL